ncbi:hypothetical protein ACMAZF_04570 [Psychrobium sp. nBUS_13]|uniref:hypothetical protein n=1 Tax=Psychrobium sp. nBUS_13 TaxID=3395319 RepID=UPI003EBF4BA4
MLLSLFSWLSPYAGRARSNAPPNTNTQPAGAVASPTISVPVKPGAPARAIISSSATGENMNTVSNQIKTASSTSNETKTIKGNPWLAIIIALIATAYLLLLLFAWVAQESVFKNGMFSMPYPEIYQIFPSIIEQPNNGRFVTAKLLTFYLSYPLVVILTYLVYQYLVTALHWFGCYCAKLKYITPNHRLYGVAFVAEIAPVFGLMSSLWALMNKGGDAEYVRWVMCRPSFLGMACYAMALIYLHWAPQQVRA